MSTPSPQPYSSCWYTGALSLTSTHIQTYIHAVDPSSNLPRPAADPQILSSPVALCIETNRWVSWSTSRPHSLHSSRPGPPGPSSSQFLQLSDTERLTGGLLEPRVSPVDSLDLLAPPVSRSEEKMSCPPTDETGHLEAANTRWQQCSTRLIWIQT